MKGKDKPQPTGDHCLQCGKMLMDHEVFVDPDLCRKCSRDFFVIKILDKNDHIVKRVIKK